MAAKPPLKYKPGMRIFRPQGDLIVCFFFVLPIVPRLKACPMIFLPGAPVGKTGEYSLILSTAGFAAGEVFLKIQTRDEKKPVAPLS